MPLVNPSLAGAGIDQLRHELVVRHVRRKRGEQPVGDLLAPAIDVAGAAIIIPQQVIPERQPVFGVMLIVGQQTAHQTSALVAGRRR